MIAGFFTRHGLVRYDTPGYLRRRFQRIGLPLLSGIILLLPLQELVIQLAQSGGETFHFDPRRLIPTHSNFNLQHLWFLYHILVYSLGMMFLHPVLEAGPVTRALVWIHRSRIRSICIWILLNLGLAWFMMRYSEPHHAWTPLSKMGLHFPMFLFGYLLHGFPEARDNLLRIGSWHAFMMGVLTLGLLLMPSPSGLIPRLLVDISLMWLMTLGALALLRRFGNLSHPVLGYLNRCSYAVYLFHQPIIVLVAWLLLRSWPGISPWTGYAITCLFSLSLTYASVEVLVNRWGLGGYLFTGNARSNVPSANMSSRHEKID